MSLNVDLLTASGRIFDGQPDPSRYFAVPATESVRTGLRQGLEDGRGISVLIGPAGSGKTLLLQAALQDLPPRWAHVAQLAYTSMSGAEILRSMAYAFGMAPGQPADAPSPIAWTEAQLRHWAARGETSLLVIDEAHNLPIDALRPLLAMSQGPAAEQAPLHLILAGHPALSELLAAPELKAQASAIGQTFVAPPFQAQESAAYITDRLSQLTDASLPAFPQAATAEIHRRAQGLPGHINTLCQQLLHRAILQESSVSITVSMVAALADELGFDAAPAVENAPAPTVDAHVEANTAPPPRKSRAVPALMLLALIATAAGVFFYSRPAPPNEPASTTKPAEVAPALPVEPSPGKAPETSSLPLAPAQADADADATANANTAADLAPPQTSSPPPRLTANTKSAATRPAHAASPDCAPLLAQLSLGEPLTVHQKHTLESTCR